MADPSYASEDGQNIGFALFGGNPLTAGKMANDKAHRDAESALAGYNAARAAGQQQQNDALAGLGSLFDSFKSPNGAPMSTEDIASRVSPALLPALIQSGQGAHVGDIINAFSAFSGNDKAALRGLVASGHMPNENTAVSPEMQNAIAGRNSSLDTNRQLAVEGAKSAAMKKDLSPLLAAFGDPSAGAAPATAGPDYSQPGGVSVPQGSTPALLQSFGVHAPVTVGPDPALTSAPAPAGDVAPVDDAARASKLADAMIKTGIVSGDERLISMGSQMQNHIDSMQNHDDTLNARKDRHVDDQISKYTKETEDASESFGAIKNAQDILKKYPKGHIPGFGPLDSHLPNFALADGGEARQAIQQLGLVTTKGLVGKRYSQAEISRIDNAIGFSVSQDGQRILYPQSSNNLRGGIRDLTKLFDTSQRAKSTFMSPDALKAYNDRGGTSPPDMFSSLIEDSPYDQHPAAATPSKNINPVNGDAPAPNDTSAGSGGWTVKRVK